MSEASAAAGRSTEAPIQPVDRWGPFALDLEPVELRARLLRGPRAADLCRLLARAETDPNALEPACRALNAMAANDKRQIWAAYAALARSAA